MEAVARIRNPGQIYRIAKEPYIKMRERILRTLHALHCDESGQDLTEYALVAVVIAFAGITAMRGLATGINNAFSAIGSEFGKSVS